MRFIRNIFAVSALLFAPIIVFNSVYAQANVKPQNETFAPKAVQETVVSGKLLSMPIEPCVFLNAQGQPVSCSMVNPLPTTSNGDVPAVYALSSGNITAVAEIVSLNVSQISNVTAFVYPNPSMVGHNSIFEGSLNSTNGTDGNWFTLQAVRSNSNTIETATGVLAAAPSYSWELSVNGLNWFRVRATAHTSGTATWNIQPAPYATEPIPAVQLTSAQPISGAISVSGTASVIPNTPLEYTLSSAANTNAAVIKSSSGQMCALTISNEGASTAFVKFYNKTTTPTVGTDIPVIVIPVPASGFVNPQLGVTCHRLGTGIGIAITRNMVQTDTTAVGLNEVKIKMSYL